MLTFATELRQAWRSLLQRKAYFFTCAATLTLVLGANAAIFAVINATLLRPMPFATNGEVLQIFDQPPGTTAVLQRNPLQQMEVARLRASARTLARLEGFLLSERVVTRSGRPDVAQTAAVTPGLLPMMGRRSRRDGCSSTAKAGRRSTWRSSPIVTGATRLAAATCSAHRW